MAKYFSVALYLHYKKTSMCGHTLLSIVQAMNDAKLFGFAFFENFISFFFKSPTLVN